MATSITVAQALAYEQDPSQIPPNTVFNIIDTAANIEKLTAHDILGLSPLSVTSIVASDGPVTFTPGSAVPTALTNHDINITAHVSVSEAISLDVEANMRGGPLIVPPTEHLIVVDTAANIETLTPLQISDLGNAVDTATATGDDSGTSAVTRIAATDAPAVFTPDQVNALANAGIAIVAPPSDPDQNDGSTVVTGRGMTVDLIWDSSVASAPAAFQADVEEAVQFLADTYSSSAPLYFHVGYGEDDGSKMGALDLGTNEPNGSPSESYATLLGQLTTDATSPAQLAALSTLPATDPTGTTTIDFTPALAQTLGVADAGTSSADDPDGYLGFASGTAWDYSADPNQTPVSGEYDFIGTVEHEFTEELGRISGIDNTDSQAPSDSFSLIDLYRFSAPDTRALSSFDNPSYFSIDNGVTNLGDWNNYTEDKTGDLADWSGTTVNGALKHTPDSFNDISDPNLINPFTSTDATLMNVLGYDFTSAPTSPIPLPSTDVGLSAGQLLEDLTLDQINPGSADPPAGDSYVVIDSAFAIESLTAPEIRDALSIGVSEFIADGSIAFLQDSDDPRDDQIAALGTTPVIAALTVSEALSAEAAADQALPPTIPVAETVVVADAAANIETLSPAQIDALGSIGASQLDVSDLSGTGPLIVQNGDTYLVHGAVTADETIDFDSSGGVLELDDTPDMKGTISGFVHGDQIVLSDIAFDANGSVNLLTGNSLDISENGSADELQFTSGQDFAGDFFHLHAGPNGGTEIIENTTPCYCRGILIEAEHGQKRVEDLEIGDRVMTKAGVTRPIKWIGRRSFGGRFVLGRRDILPICIKAGALESNVPRRDLWISPHHAMYFKSASFAGRSVHGDGVLVEAKDLVNGTSIVQAESVDTVEYFHIELDTHDVIVAEGALSESFLDDDSRAMFHNAHEFHALYPEATTSRAHYCAPRLDAGYELDAVRQRIALRARLSPVDPRRAAPLHGYVDAIGPYAIEGWAQNSDAPEAPVCLDIFISGRRLGQTLANRFREDLAAAGLGSGRHGFRFELPAGLAIGAAPVEVRRSLDGRRLVPAAQAFKRALSYGG